MQEEQQRALSAEGSAAARAAHVLQLEKELAEATMLADSLGEQQRALGEQHLALVATSSTSTSTSSETSTVTALAGAARSRTNSSSVMPEGGEVAKGVGVMVTINNRERESILSLRTTVSTRCSSNVSP